jgi:hypothetical protein
MDSTRLYPGANPRIGISVDGTARIWLVIRIEPRMLPYEELTPHHQQ